MKATETKLLNFLKGPKQFVIPIYQRTYSWTTAQCEQLWKDIMRVAQDDTVSGHFIGSIVYIERGLYNISSIPQLLVIDGQQRLTTLSLLISALTNAFRDNATSGEMNAKKLVNYFLINNEEEDSLRYKLLLTQQDRETLTRIVENSVLPSSHSRRIVENYQYFTTQIARCSMDLDILYQGIAKLIMVDIALDREHDNPQLIFESLNSTGLALARRI